MRFVPSSNRGLVAIGAIAILSVGCGSRTPLDVDPSDGAVLDPSDLPDGDEGERCFTSSQLVGEIPIDLYFMMDKSTSMNTFDRGQSVSRWNAVSAAMNNFIRSPVSVGLGAGIAFFPRADSGGTPLCSSADYAFPVVPIGTLPDVVSSISIGIARQALSMGTPTTPALQGAHIYARNRTHSGRTAAVVLVTDGQPRQCNSTIATTSAVATQASGGSPSIKTYVLGVGPSLSSLNAIAEAGGTGHAYLVESGGANELTDALDEIRNSALSCAYVIPDGGRKSADRGRVRVETRTGPMGQSTPLGEVPSREACGGLPGWYFERSTASDTPDAAPSRVELCPLSCQSLVKASGSHLDVAIGCSDAGRGT